MDVTNFQHGSSGGAGFAAVQLIPPINFGMVEENLFRSGMPNECNFPFLERLRLRKVVYLAPEEPSQQFVSFVEDQDIELIRLPGASERERLHKGPWRPISEETVLAALDVVLDSATYAGDRGLLVMCGLGRHRTGTVVACFRKLQRWNLVSILEEYRRYAGEKFPNGPRAMVNEQFIELFDTDLVRRARAPATADVQTVTAAAVSAELHAGSQQSSPEVVPEKKEEKKPVTQSS